MKISGFKNLILSSLLGTLSVYGSSPNPFFYSLNGRAYLDKNNNNVYDAGIDVLVPGQKITVNNYEFTTRHDAWYFIRHSYTTATAVPANSFKNYNVNPGTVTKNYTSDGQILYQDFALTPKAGNLEDMSLTFGTNWPSPTFCKYCSLSIRVSYRNVGTSAKPSSVVTMVIPSQFVPVNSTVPYTFSGNTLTWNVGNVDPLQTGYFDVTFSLNSSAVAGTELAVIGGINLSSLSDVDMSNNSDTYSMRITASKDPNEKAGPTSISPAEVAAGKYLDYTIRFENIGTAPAQHVYITDYLDTRVDMSSIEFVNSSHPCEMLKVGGSLHFTFSSIYLPYTTPSDPYSSSGYVRFRVKPRSVAVLGTVISNKANIVFDDNEAIVTNTVQTVVKDVGPLKFDGANDYVEVKNYPAINFGTGNFTMEAWIKADPIQTSYPQIMSKRKNYDGFLFGLWTDGKPFIQMGGNTGNWVCDNCPSLEDNVCHHVAISRNEGLVSYYVDGTLRFTRGVGNLTRNMTSEGDLMIGMDRVSSSNTAFNGNIEEVRLWNVAQTSAQIASNYNKRLTGNETSLVAYYKVKGSEGNLLFPAKANTPVGVLGSSSAPDANDPLWTPTTSCFNIYGGRTITNTDLAQEYNALFTVSPNPSKDGLFVLNINEESSIQLKDIQIYNGMGGKVNLEVKLEPGQQTLDLSTLNNGVYLMVAKHESGITTTQRLCISK